MRILATEIVCDSDDDEIDCRGLIDSTAMTVDVCIGSSMKSQTKVWVLPPQRSRPSSPPDDACSTGMAEEHKARPMAVSFRPTVKTLDPEVVRPGFDVAIEWDILSADELACAASIRWWLGADAFASVPFDILVSFIRGMAYREDWHESAYAYLHDSIRWRRAMGCDMVLASDGTSGFDHYVPPSRALFDTCLPSGMLGYDQEGHMIVLDRLFITPCAALMSDFTDEEFIRHLVRQKQPQPEPEP